MHYKINNSNTNFIDIYVSISPKCASTKILTIFFNELNCCSFQKFHDKANKTNLISDFEIKNTNRPKIKFVRNPYERIVSAYLHFMRAHKKMPLSFKNFVEKVNIFLNNGNKNDKIFADERFNLHLYLQYDEDIKYDHIIKIEDLNDGIKILNDDYKMNLKINKSIVNGLNKKNKVLTIDYATSIYDNYKHNIPYEYKYFYNDYIKTIVYKIYKNDIINFKYNI